jgi:long-chain acyl-CoA synthetase
MVQKDSVTLRIKRMAEQYPNRIMLHSKRSSSYSDSEQFHAESFAEIYSQVEALGAGLKKLGIQRGEHLGIISDNRKEWLLADLAILGLGAADVPRGSDSTQEEIAYILKHAGCEVVFCENKAQQEKIVAGMDKDSKIRILILMDNSISTADLPGDKRIQLIGIGTIIEEGKSLLAKEPQTFDQELMKTRAEDLATLIYTSGTTGEPKGVMLTHYSFLFQMDRLGKILELGPTDLDLSVLPVWHSFERAVEYIILNVGGAIAYSKPIGKIMLADMATLRPTILPSVPRIWESIMAAVMRNVKSQSKVKQGLFGFFLFIGQSFAYFKNMFLGRIPQYSKPNRILEKIIAVLPLILLAPLNALGSLLVFKNIKAKLGGRFRAGISGGGALPGYVDMFFHSAGIKILEGYGLTETGPVLSVREMDNPIFGTVGNILPDVNWKILDEQGHEVSEGKKGVLWVKSPQVMQGYYKRPEATEAVLKDGWLNTGDLVIATYEGQIKIIGREKDTIVLLGGENIEPEPIEARLLKSEYIEQAMVVGQDKKYLGALIVPNLELLEKFAQDNEISYLEPEELAENAEIQEFLHGEIQGLVNAKTGFKHFERVLRFTIFPKPFEVGTEMTRTLKLKRNVIAEKYKAEIAKIFQ